MEDVFDTFAEVFFEYLDRTFTASSEVSDVSLFEAEAMGYKLAAFFGVRVYVKIERSVRHPPLKVMLAENPKRLNVVRH